MQRPSTKGDRIQVPVLSGGDEGEDWTHGQCTPPLWRGIATGKKKSQPLWWGRCAGTDWSGNEGLEQVPGQWLWSGQSWPNCIQIGLAVRIRVIPTKHFTLPTTFRPHTVPTTYWTNHILTSHFDHITNQFTLFTNTAFILNCMIRCWSGWGIFQRVKRHSRQHTRSPGQGCPTTFPTSNRAWSQVRWCAKRSTKSESRSPKLDCLLPGLSYVIPVLKMGVISPLNSKTVELGCFNLDNLLTQKSWWRIYLLYACRIVLNAVS